MAQPTQPNLFQGLFNLAITITGTYALFPQAIGDILRHGQMWEHGIILEHHICRAAVGGHPHHGLAVD